MRVVLKTFVRVSLNSRLESNKEEEEGARTWISDSGVLR